MMDKAALAGFVAVLEEIARRPADGFDLRSGLRVIPEQGACLWTLYQELVGAFSYRPGRLEALAPLTALARKVMAYDADAPLRMYEEPEWRAFGPLRGPVENVTLHVCQGCQRPRVSFGTSPYLEESSAVCDACGAAIFQSYHDERPLPPCDCGGTYQPFGERCLACGSAATRLEEQSPYQYFAAHTWKRRT